MFKTKKLFNKNFNILLVGQFGSELGTAIFNIVIILFLKKTTGSGTVMGFVEMVAFLPAVILGPFAGTIVDKFNRKLIIILSDFISGIAIILLSFAGLKFIAQIGEVEFLGVFIDFSKLKIQVWHIILVTIIISIAQSFFRPAVNSMLPDIVPSNELKKANSISELNGQITTFAGVSFGGVLFTTFGAPVLIFINGISYLFSSLIEIFIKIPKQEEKSKIIDVNDYWKKTKQGFEFIWNFKGLKYLIMSSMIANAFMPPLILCLPFFVEDTLNLSSEYFSYLISSCIAGSIMGYVIYGFFRTSGKIDYIAYRLSCIIGPLAIYVISYSTSIVIIFILFTLASSTLSIITLINITVIQKIVPTEKRGRVMGTMDSLVAGIYPISFALSGIMIDFFNKDIRYIIFIISLCFLIINLYIFFNIHIKKMIIKTCKSDVT